MKSSIHKLRVNIKSLTAEARFIRNEIGRAWDKDAREDLRSHRLDRVRPEARLAHLAIAYLRGIPYKTVEKAARVEPSVSNLTRKINRFEQVTPADVKSWLNT